MSELPRSFLILLAFVLLAIGLILYFVSKQFLFRRYKHRGDEALKRGEYQDAIKSFGRAEALWELNVTKQTIPSYQRDLTRLEELLNGLDAAARSGGVALPVDECRQAVKAVQTEFQGNETCTRSSSGTACVSALMRLKVARGTLREQLRRLISNK